MKPELIVMLTYNDETVKNGAELFSSMRQAPVVHWGFKDVGLPVEEMKRLVGLMKDAGKTTYLEVVSLSEAEGLRGAQIAVEAGFDVLMGTVYFDSIRDYLQGKPTRYYPFPGHVFDHPSILDGTIDEIAAHALFLESRGAAGLDLLTYRYTGDAPALLRAVVDNIMIPLVSAGSIASYPRIAEVWDAGAWGFTIGSAFFDQKFVPGGTFQENVLAVCEWLERTQESDLPEILAAG